MNRRLAELISKIDTPPEESVILDCYNQAVVKDVAITITTRINELVIEPIMEQPTDRVIQVLNTVPDEELKSWDNPQRGRTFSPEGISPCLTLATEGNIKIMEVGNIYPSGGQGGKVVDPDGIAPTVCECHGEVTRIVEAPEEIEYVSTPDGGLRGIRPKTHTTPGAGVQGERYDNLNGVGSTITTQHQPKVIIPAEAEVKYRIRKLHPIETYRLQDVDDEHIDKLVNTKDEKGNPMLSKSAHYNLSGDSITVNCLYLIFENLFYGDNTNRDPQLTLF